MRPLSEAWFLGLFIGGQALCVLVIWVGFRLGLIGTASLHLAVYGIPIRTPYPPVAHGCLVLGVLIAIGCLGLAATTVPWCVLMYRGWAAIQDGCARTTPGLAVGLCFIPCFGAFWAFRALNGFAHDCNRFARRHEIAGLHVKEWRYLSLAICTLAGSMSLQWYRFTTLPLILVAQMVGWLLAVTVIPEVCAAVTAISRVQERAVHEAGAAAAPADA